MSEEPANFDSNEMQMTPPGARGVEETNGVDSPAPEPTAQGVDAVAAEQPRNRHFYNHSTDLAFQQFIVVPFASSLTAMKGQEIGNHRAVTDFLRDKNISVTTTAAAVGGGATRLRTFPLSAPVDAGPVWRHHELHVGAAVINVGLEGCKSIWTLSSPAELNAVAAELAAASMAGIVQSPLWMGVELEARKFGFEEYKDKVVFGVTCTEEELARVLGELARTEYGQLKYFSVSQASGVSGTTVPNIAVPTVTLSVDGSPPTRPRPMDITERMNTFIVNMSEQDFDGMITSKGGIMLRNLFGATAIVQVQSIKEVYHEAVRVSFNVLASEKRHAASVMEVVFNDSTSGKYVAAKFGVEERDVAFASRRAAVPRLFEAMGLGTAIVRSSGSSPQVVEKMNEHIQALNQRIDQVAAEARNVGSQVGSVFEATQAIENSIEDLMEAQDRSVNLTDELRRTSLETNARAERIENNSQFAAQAIADFKSQLARTEKRLMDKAQIKFVRSPTSDSGATSDTPPTPCEAADTRTCSNRSRPAAVRALLIISALTSAGSCRFTQVTDVAAGVSALIRSPERIGRVPSVTGGYVRTRGGFGGSMVRVEYGSILGNCSEYLCNPTSSRTVSLSSVSVPWPCLTGSTDCDWSGRPWHEREASAERERSWRASGEAGSRQHRLRLECGGGPDTGGMGAAARLPLEAAGGCWGASRPISSVCQAAVSQDESERRPNVDWTDRPTHRPTENSTASRGAVGIGISGGSSAYGAGDGYCKRLGLGRRSSFCERRTVIPLGGRGRFLRGRADEEHGTRQGLAYGHHLGVATSEGAHVPSHAIQEALAARRAHQLSDQSLCAERPTSGRPSEDMVGKAGHQGRGSIQTAADKEGTRRAGDNSPGRQASNVSGPTRQSTLVGRREASSMGRRLWAVHGGGGDDAAHGHHSPRHGGANSCNSARRRPVMASVRGLYSRVIQRVHGATGAALGWLGGQPPTALWRAMLGRLRRSAGRGAPSVRSGVLRSRGRERHLAACMPPGSLQAADGSGDDGGGGEHSAGSVGHAYAYTLVQRHFHGATDEGREAGGAPSCGVRGVARGRGHDGKDGEKAEAAHDSGGAAPDPSHALRRVVRDTVCRAAEPEPLQVVAQRCRCGGSWCCSRESARCVDRRSREQLGGRQGSGRGRRGGARWGRGRGGRASVRPYDPSLSISCHSAGHTDARRSDRVQRDGHQLRSGGSGPRARPDAGAAGSYTKCSGPVYWRANATLCHVPGRAGHSADWAGGAAMRGLPTGGDTGLASRLWASRAGRPRRGEDSSGRVGVASSGGRSAAAASDVGRRGGREALCPLGSTALAGGGPGAGGGDGGAASSRGERRDLNRWLPVPSGGVGAGTIGSQAGRLRWRQAAGVSCGLRRNATHRRRRWAADREGGSRQASWMGGNRPSAENSTAERGGSCSGSRLRHKGAGGVMVQARRRRRRSANRRAGNAEWRAAHGNILTAEERRSEGRELLMSWNGQRFAAGAASSKRTWLASIMEEERPTVIGLQEVMGGHSDFVALRRWARRRHYGLVWLVGRDGVAAKALNGVALLWCEAQAVLVGKHSTVGPDNRALGATIRFKSDGRLACVVVVHGIHDVSRRVQQLRACEAFVRPHGGGIVFGDFNATPCEQWRRSASGGAGGESRRSRAAIRSLAGWSCDCCCPGGDVSEGAIVGGAAATEEGDVGWTRRGKNGSAARLDYFVANGVEAGWWRLDDQREGEGLATSEAQAGDVQSDHLAILVEAIPRPRGADGREWRPKAVARGRRGLGPRVNARLRRDEGTIAGMMAGARGAARSAGASRLEAARNVLLAEGRDVEQALKSNSQLKLNRAPARRVYEDAKRQLESAKRLRGSGISPWEIEGHGLMYRSAGISKMLTGMPQGLASPDRAWRRIIRRLRRRCRRAAAALDGAGKRRAKEIAVLAARVQSGQARFEHLCAQLRPRMVSSAMDGVRKEDEPNGEYVHSSSAEFVEVSAQIGNKAVAGMDIGNISEAIAAWARIFTPCRGVIRGSDGNEWAVEKEFSFAVFIAALYAMPKGKAVGQSGFSVELLLAFPRGGRVQRQFYDSLMDDLRVKAIPASWRVVIYALLVKPPPNRAELVRERREIAIMEQEMKLTLQMAKRTAYGRVAGNLSPVNAGWGKGSKTADATVQVSAVIQQAIKMQRSLWLLMIDLKTFFSAIDREGLRLYELRTGLPPAVLDLIRATYGGRDDGGTPCRFDSAGGLGGTFYNHHGALMGCVVSPDKAKIYIDSVIRAIEAAVGGVPLWGAGGDEVGQAAFGDDWLGAFHSEQQVQAAWAIWRAWAACHGMTLGVKEYLKTVVTGIRFDENGTACDIEDPALELREKAKVDGKWVSTVPVMRRDQAYKHLGIMLRADGVQADNFKRLKGAVAGAMANLGKLRGASVREFEQISEVLMSGYVNFYTQSSYMTRAEAEELEKLYRHQFARKFGTPRGTAAVQFYGAGRRTHAWALGTAAFVDNMVALMSDVDDIPRRTAARSAVALAASRWGCRQDPLTWNCKARRAQLEAALATAGARDMGEGFWLAMLQLNEASEETESRQHTAGLRRLRGDGPKDPLRADAVWFLPFESTPLFEGGLELKWEDALGEAGVLAVGHMCKWEWGQDGEATAVLLTDFDEAIELRPDLKGTTQGLREAWLRVAGELVDEGVAPEPPELTASWREGCVLPRAPAMVSEGRAEEMMKLARSMEAAVASRAAPEAAEVWEARIRSATCTAALTPARSTWAAGRADCEAVAKGPRLVYDMPCGQGRTTVTARGGEAQWLRRQDLDEEGWVRGWEGRVHEAFQQVTVDGEGRVCERRTGRQLTALAAGVRVAEAAEEEAALAALYDEASLGEDWAMDMAEDMAWDERTRAVHGAETAGPQEPESAAEVSEQPATAARYGPAVEMVVRATELQAEPWDQATVAGTLRRLVTWAARLGDSDTAVVSLDGSRKVVSMDKSSELRAGRAVVMHDGRVQLHRNMDPCNYRAELAAQMDAAKSRPAKRLIIEFDASSPPGMLQRFLRLGPQRQRQAYLRHWAAEWWRELQHFEIVVMLWQKSHTKPAEPVNSWADAMAEHALQCEEYDEHESTGTCSFASLEAEGVSRGLRQWAVTAAQAGMVTWLRRTSQYTQLRSPTDIQLPPLSRDGQIAAWGVAGGRMQFGDARRFISRRLERLTAGGMCPFGCERGGERLKFTWAHVAFECQQCELVGLRRLWHGHMLAADSLVTDGGRQPNPGWTQAVERVLDGFDRDCAARAMVAPPGRPTGQLSSWRPIEELSKNDLSLRRIVCGYIEGDGLRGGRRLKEVVATVVEAGLAVQTRAAELTKALVREASEAEAVARRLRPAWDGWRAGVASGGPRRFRELRRAAEARATVARWAAWRQSAGGGAWSAAALRQAADRAAIMVTGLVERAAARRFLSVSEAAGEWRAAELLLRWRKEALRRKPGGPGQPAHVAEAACYETAMALMAFEGGGAVAIPVHMTWRAVDSEPAGWLRSMAAESVVVRRWRAACGEARVAEAARLADERSGRCEDRWGRWAVQRVIAARPGKGREILVHVRWKGGHEEPTGWCQMGDLNAGAKATARRLLRKWRQRHAPAEEGPERWRRKSPRIAGVPPVRGL